MSRGRPRNDLYLAVDTGRDDVAHAPRSPDSIEARVAGIERSAAQRMAMDGGGLSR